VSPDQDSSGTACQGCPCNASNLIFTLAPYSDPITLGTGLVRSLKAELGKRQLRIDALCPSGIDTGIIPHDQRTDQAVFMTPENVADEVLMLFGRPQSQSCD